jgi:hypothetical protein
MPLTARDVKVSRFSGRGENLVWLESNCRRMAPWHQGPRGLSASLAVTGSHFGGLSLFVHRCKRGARLIDPAAMAAGPYLRSSGTAMSAEDKREES